MERFMHGGDRYKNTVKLDFSININPLGMPKQVKTGDLSWNSGNGILSRSIL